MKEVILLISFFLSFCGSILASNRIYYVSPVDEGGTCDVGGDIFEPCLPLTNYTQDMLNHPPLNITLQFLPGEHLITSQYSLSLWNVNTFLMLPYDKRGNATVTVRCSSNGSLSMILDAKVYKMLSMNILSCSTSMIFTLNKASLDSQHHIELFNCSFHDNVAGSVPALLRVIQQGVFMGNLVFNLSASSFTGNRLINRSLVSVKFSDRLSTRNVTVKNCSFQNNSVASILNITSVTLLEVTGCTFTNNNMSQVEVSFGEKLLSRCYYSIRRFYSKSYGISMVCHYCNIFKVINSTFIGVNINYSVGIKASQILSAYISNCKLKKQSVILNNDEPDSTVVLSNCIFSNSFDTMYIVQIRNLSIENSSFISNRADPAGGALFVINCRNVVMSDVNFTNNSAKVRGGAIYAENSVLKTPHDRDTAINICSNTAGINGGGIVLAKGAKLELSSRGYLYFSNNSVAAQGGKGGAMFIACSEPEQVSILLLIMNSYFTSNRAYYGGALAILNCENVVMSFVNFTNNSAAESGGAIYAENSVLRTPHDSDTVINVNSNTARRSGGGIALKKTKLELSYGINLYFSNNNVSARDGKGGAIFVACSLWVLEVNNISIMNSYFTSNKAYYGGALAILNCENVTMSDVIFTDNSAKESGGAVYAKNSVLRAHHVQDTIINFSSNTAERSGGGVALATGAKLELSYRANFNFYNNSVSAQDGKGGALFITSDSDCTVNDTCPISYQGGSLHFAGNHAINGSVVYKSQLDSILCFMEIFKAEDFLDPVHAITSDTVMLCFCENNESNCTPRETDLPSRYPGQSIDVSIVTLHVLNIPISSKIESHYNDSEVTLRRDETTQSVPAKCQEMKFHVYSKTKVKSAVKLNIEPLNLRCKTLYSMLMINFDIKPCPRGFEISKDKCICDKRLGHVDGCDIEGQTNNSKYNGWFEYDENYLKFNQHFCPLGYCTKNYSFLHTQCANNHTGVLCGACVDNYSIGLGSWRCLQCTHSSQYNFIWLVPLMAIAGVVLVVFLLLLKLTVSSGTIYGLIFYANIISVSRITNLPDCSINPPLSVFISWLNLDFGIETCFYSGMDTYQKTWLQFAFPLYIWFLVGIIIIVCHYSSRAMKLMGKRCIDILATLFLLSYAKLLKTIITVFSFVNIMIAKADSVSDPLVTHKVWTFDGNIDYLKGKHLSLFVVASFFLVFLFLPYTLLLTFGQCLRSLPRKRGLRWARSTAFISIMDAYHAPYNRRHRYWTGLTLLTRCVLFTIFAANTKIYSTLICSLQLSSYLFCWLYDF